MRVIAGAPVPTRILKRALPVLVVVLVRVCSCVFFETEKDGLISRQCNIYCDQPRGDHSYIGDGVRVIALMFLFSQDKDTVVSAIPQK